MATTAREVKNILNDIKESKPVNYATLGVLGFATFYEATQFGGDISNTAALSAVTGAQVNRILNRYKIKV